MVLFAGSHGWPTGLGDTWEYDGASWYPVSIAGASPQNQYLHRMVGDPSRGGIIVYGAFGDGWSPLNETWRYHRASLVASTLTPAIGTTVSFILSVPGDAGLPYQAAVSLSGTCPGTALNDGRVIPLNVDFATLLSVGTLPSIFQGFSGTLNAAGGAIAMLAIPAESALSGAAISAAFVTMNGLTIGSISNAVTLVVQ